MILQIYDTGQVYSLEIDLDNPPEWLLRALGKEERPLIAP